MQKTIYEYSHEIYYEVFPISMKNTVSPFLSIVIPVYNESDNIITLLDEIQAVLADQKNYEIIIVDDGSTDSTFSLLIKNQNLYPQLTIIKLRKNFGKATAFNTAFKFVHSEIVITMDGDLQDDPKEIPQFIAKIEEGYDLVSGWKYPRNDPLSKILPSKIFNHLTRIITGVNIHDFNCGYKAYKKIVLENIDLYGEMHRYIPALAAWNGFKISEIKINHRPRRFGRSKFDASRLFRGLLDLITVKFLTNYSSRPLHIFGLLGIISLLAGFIIGIYLLILKYFQNVAIGDRPLLLLAVLLIFIGLQFVSMGLLGEMITLKEHRDLKVDHYIETVIGEHIV